MTSEMKHSGQKRSRPSRPPMRSSVKLSPSRLNELIEETTVDGYGESEELGGPRPERAEVGSQKLGLMLVAWARPALEGFRRCEHW